MSKLKLPLGIDRFEKVIESGCYYVDKTDFIRELLEDTFEVNLITRPRRFGKTLTMSMLAEFFDIRKDSRRLFEGLSIIRNDEFCRRWMNQWPLLFLTLKDVNGRDFPNAYDMLKFVISGICMEHGYLKDSPAVDPDDIETFLRLKSGRASRPEIQCALYTIMRMMAAHYGKPVILLIDEYDVPLAKASDNGYYEEMLESIRSLLGMAWKTNPSLKFAVITGCLRIAKESIFTGANNFISNSISGPRYRESFGFTETEVKKLLTAANCASCYDDLKKWYDGYRFCGCEIYCPWDVINHISLLQLDRKARPESYWKDTSHNHIIRKFIDIRGDSIQEKMETLLAGGYICERILEDLTYDLDHSHEENLWSILYLTGYLTQAAGETEKDDRKKLCIPNEEVRTIFADTVAKWFTDQMEREDRSALFTDWWEGKEENLSAKISEILFRTISYFDYKEDYYHAFLAGLFSGAGYAVASNPEMGTGRADLVVTERRRRRAILVEIKRAASEDDMKTACRRALQQIDERQYAETLYKQGFQHVLCYGIAFCRKSCLVQLKKQS